MVTAGIKHNFRVGQYFWSLNCLEDMVFQIVNITPKRIVAKHVGKMEGRKVFFHGDNYSVSNFRPQNIFLVDFPVNPRGK